MFHGVAAYGFFVVTPLGFLLIGSGAEDKRVKRLSLVCGVLALFTILVLPFITLAPPFSVGFAAPEPIQALIISAWVIYVATRLYRGLI